MHTPILQDRYLAKLLLYSHTYPEGSLYFSPKDPNFRQFRLRLHKHTNPACCLCPWHAALLRDQGAGAGGGFDHQQQTGAGRGVMGEDLQQPNQAALLESPAEP